MRQSAAATERGERHGAVILVVAAGGVLGALARHGITVAFPHGPQSMPWATLAVNITGCLLIGLLMPLVTEVWTGRRLLRPFLGVGVLGGFTTFSTYVVDVQHSVAAGAVGVAMTYLAATMLGALIAVFAGASAMRWVVRRR